MISRSYARGHHHLPHSSQPSMQNIATGNRYAAQASTCHSLADSALAIQCTHIETSIAMLQKLQNRGVGFLASNMTLSVSMLKCTCGGKPNMFAGTAGSNPGMKDMPLSSLCTSVIMPMPMLLY